MMCLPRGAHALLVQSESVSAVIHPACGLVSVTVTARDAAINQTPVEKAADEHIFAQTDVSDYQRYKVAFLHRKTLCLLF